MITQKRRVSTDYCAATRCALTEASGTISHEVGTLATFASPESEQRISLGRIQKLAPTIPRNW
jgi:hypothetical protein